MPFDQRIRQIAFTISPAAILANTSAEQTFNDVPDLGSEASDLVLSVNKPTAQAGLGIVGFRLTTTDNQLAITFGNFTGSSITPTASESYKIAVMKRQP